jgi:hypothetical protein
LVTVYVTTDRDLSSVGGPRDGQVVDSVVQEIDIESGRVLLEWSSLRHVGLEESYKPMPTRAADAWDYFHVNSVDVDRDGNLLVSARNTHAVYKLDRTTGRVMWRLGGKRSDFAMGTGTRFAWQHDARRQRDGSLTLFDNQASPKRAPQSRGLAIALDERRRRATRLRQYTHPRRLLSNNQANMQVLGNGNVMIGWGFHPYATEFAPRGRVLFDARFADPGTSSYRAYRFAWNATPATSPDVAVRRSGSRMTVYASWNGATGVVRWRVLAGASADSIQPVATGRRRGFETALPVRDVQGCVAVEALDRAGRVLGASPVRCG